jgi:hypothetical protein
MVGQNPLWVAKQHGHSIMTMLRVYAAWAEGMVETDIAAIKHAMANRPMAMRSPSKAPADAGRPKPFAGEFASSPHRPDAKCSKRMGKIWRRERDSNRLRAPVESTTY